MTLPPIRLSPSGQPLAFSATSDDITNESIVEGSTASLALTELYTRRVQYLDVNDDPVGLWNFNDTLAAVRGPTLSSTAGTFAFSDVYPGLRGIWINTGARLDAAPAANLILTGAMSVELILQLQTDPPLPWLCGVGGLASSELESNNAVWSLGFPSLVDVVPRTMRAFWETGAGTDVQFLTSSAPGGPSYPLIHQIASIGLSRAANGVTQPYLDGRPFGAPSAPITLPTGGANGVLSLGAQLGQTSPGQVLLLSLAVYNRARSAAEWRASFDRSIGQGTGFLS